VVDEPIRHSVPSSEFAAVTDVPLLAEDKGHNFVRQVLRDAAVEHMPLDSFASWVPKLRPFIQ
jgi:hypothetical protein